MMKEKNIQLTGKYLTSRNPIQVSASPADFVSLNATISCTEIVPQSTKKTKSGDIADT